MNRGRKSFYAMALMLALAFAGGCGDVKDQVSGVVNELATVVGKEVASLDLVNNKLVQGASNVIAVLKEMNMSLSYKENGIQFTSKDLNGTVGLNANTLFLDVRSTAKDGNSVQSMVRLANVFSPGNSVEEKLNAIKGSDQLQTYQLNNGSIEAGQGYIKLHMETSLQ